MSNRYVVRLAASLCSAHPRVVRQMYLLECSPVGPSGHTWNGCQKGSEECLQVVPTVTVLAMMKARLTGAVKGHALLKKKADALTLRHAASCSCAALHLGREGCCGVQRLRSGPRAARVTRVCEECPRLALSDSTLFLEKRELATAAARLLAPSLTRPCGARAQVPPDPEEDRADEAGDGEDHARRRLCADGGQVCGRRIFHHRARQRGVGA